MTTVYYHLVVKNNGPANAPQITAYKEAHTQALIGNGFSLTDIGYFNVSLTSGQSKAVTMICTSTGSDGSPTNPEQRPRPASSGFEPPLPLHETQRRKRRRGLIAIRSR